MGLAARGGSATAAWVQSWADRGGDHSVVMVRDLAPHAASRQASPSGRLASGLVLTGDVAGDQGLGWSSCSTQGSCTMEAATRSAHGSFSAAHSLGPVDPDEDPAVAVGPGGQVLVAWVSGGRPMAALGSAGRPLGRAHALSRSPYALDVAAAWGSSRDGLVGWSQGTLSPSVVGAAYTGP
jgi:hypothetical protein